MYLRIWKGDAWKSFENKAIRRIFILKRGEVTKRLEKISHFSCLMQANYINR